MSVTGSQTLALDVDDRLLGGEEPLNIDATVTDADGNAIDVSSNEFEWFLVDREYQDRTDAVLDESDAGVTIRTSGAVDPVQGEFRIKLSAAATDGLWGHFWQIISVTTGSGNAVGAWRRDLVIEA